MSIQNISRYSRPPDDEAPPVINGKNEIRVIQHPCTQEEFDVVYEYRRRRKSTTLRQKLKQYFQECNISSLVHSLFPALKWLPKYKYKTDIMYDIMSGFTVAVMHIPQGMAYASLGAVHPISGLYMAIFPVLVYFLMGTSRHISMGSLSIICLMAGRSVITYSTPSNATSDAMNTDSSSEPTYSPEEVASVVCLAVGMCQALLGFCKIGSLCMFMSETLISGFTSGAAVIVLTSQLQHVFGVKVSRYIGIFNVVFTISDILRKLPKTNYLALIMSLSVILFLLAYTDVIKPKLKCKFQLPVELIVMVIGTVISYYFSLKERYSINIVGPVPMGFPKPEMPRAELLPHVLVESAIIAIVSFSINISMATLFALKDNYKIYPNQEFIASGCGNIFGGLFPCLPMAVSLSRSMIQYTSGGKTQLASVFSSLFLLTVILYLGKFLEPLPYCILAGIIIKSLNSMLMKIKDLPEIWKKSTNDGIIWLLTFLSVIFLNIETGLGVALALSFISIILMNQHTQVRLLGQVPNTEIYLEIDRYIAAKSIPNVIIVQVLGGLHFANIHIAVNRIECLLSEALAERTPEIHTLVLVMSAVTFVDSAALKAINILTGDLKRQRVTVCLAQCTGRAYDQMKRCDFFNEFSQRALYPTVHDAVCYTLNEDRITDTETK